MLEKINTLDDNHTWDLVDLPKGKKIIGYKWIFVVKMNADGFMVKLKSRLVAKG